MDGCATHLGCTICLRGGTPYELRKVTLLQLTFLGEAMWLLLETLQEQLIIRGLTTVTTYLRPDFTPWFLKFTMTWDPVIPAVVSLNTVCTWILKISFFSYFPAISSWIFMKFDKQQILYVFLAKHIIHFWAFFFFYPVTTFDFHVRLFYRVKWTFNIPSQTERSVKVKLGMIDVIYSVSKRCSQNRITITFETWPPWQPFSFAHV